MHLHYASAYHAIEQAVQGLHGPLHFLEKFKTAEAERGSLLMLCV